MIKKKKVRRTASRHTDRKMGWAVEKLNISAVLESNQPAHWTRADAKKRERTSNWLFMCFLFFVRIIKAERAMLHV